MKANKVYLSRLKRGFKDKEVVPHESNVTYASCGCVYWNDFTLDIRVLQGMCYYHKEIAKKRGR